MHAGPIVKGSEEQGYEVVAIGPTTSMRMEKLEYDFISRTGVRLIIGKGGMGSLTAEACREFGAVHCVLPAGNAVFTALCTEEITDAGWLDLGMAEAFWSIKVRELGPLIVSIDSSGKNLFEEKKKEYASRKEEQLQKISKRLETIL
jgi:L(+)-tartrate dehydratase beta subunit